MSDRLLDDAQTSLEAGNVDACFRLLNSYYESQEQSSEAFETLYTTVLQLKIRYIHFKNNLAKGIMTHEMYQVQFNQLIDGLLNTLKRLKNHEASDAPSSSPFEPQSFKLYITIEEATISFEGNIEDFKQARIEHLVNSITSRVSARHPGESHIKWVGIDAGSILLRFWMSKGERILLEGMIAKKEFDDLGIMRVVSIQSISKGSEDGQSSFMAKAKDEDIVEAFQQTKDPGLIMLLLERYQHLIMRMGGHVIKNEDGLKDFLSDVYIRMVDKLKNSPIQNFRLWLMSMSRHMLYDLSSTTRLQQSHQKNSPDEVEEKDLEFEIDFALISSALEQLSDTEREVIQALYFEGKSYQDVMEALDLTFNRVRGTRDRAIRKLRAQLGSEFQNYFVE